MRRFLGLAYGVLTHLVFAWTAYRLYGFLAGTSMNQAAAGRIQAGALGWDFLLALQFVVPHSALLHPAVRRRLGRWVKPEFYGLMFCNATCLGLWIAFENWRGSPYVVWDLGGAAGWAMRAAFIGTWIALLYNLRLTGLGYQTGFTPWLHWVRGEKAPRREFTPRGTYHLLRHPVYLCFLGLLWFTPRMTLDHAVLTLCWTIYTFIGSWLKDQRLVHYLGDAYRAYQERVPGFLGMPFGPLARVRQHAPPVEDAEVHLTTAPPGERTLSMARG